MPPCYAVSRDADGKGRLGRMAADLAEFIAHQRTRLGHEKLVLLGHSWGNVIALDPVLAHPD